MRHAGKIRDHRLAADGLAEAKGELLLGVLEILARQQFAQVDGLALVVRQLDADGVAALHDGDAGRNRAHRAGDVVGQRNDARRFGARRGLELVERDDRPRADVDDLALDAEILQRALEQRARSAPARRPRRSARPASSARPEASAPEADRALRHREARAAPRAPCACPVSAPRAPVRPGRRVAPSPFAGGFAARSPCCPRARPPRRGRARKPEPCAGGVRRNRGGARGALRRPANSPSREIHRHPLPGGIRRSALPHREGS